MKIEYTPGVENALRKAMTAAQGVGSSVVLPGHVLQGLFDEEEGHPVALLAEAGVTLEKIRSLYPAIADSPQPDTDIPLWEETAELLAQAREVARLHGAEGSISTANLLLAILKGHVESRALLEGVGLDFARLESGIAPDAAPIELDEPLEFTPPTETIDTARILDASANRAREALRVLEDFARFILGDRFLSSQLKTMRHDLAEALALVPANLLLQGRDTLGDVGTTITTAAEQERASPVAVARAAAKRMQEALRSLEEFGKVLSPEFGVAVETLRYRSYTLERALLGTVDARALLADARLYVLVTESLCRASLAGTVREVLSGGAQVIQLREKDDDDRTLLDKARDLRKLTRSAGALFIVNDRPDIALLSEADGVHLGQDDMPVRDARRLLGPDALIGVSTHDLDQLRQAVLEGASYVGVGPTFPSKTKDFGNLAGLEFVRQACTETSLPAFVLGGVTLENLPQVLEAGGSRVALSHAVCAADDPKTLAAALLRQMTTDFTDNTDKKV